MYEHIKNFEFFRMVTLHKKICWLIKKKKTIIYRFVKQIIAIWNSIDSNYRLFLKKKSNDRVM